jgi:hypothetical protein
MTAARKIPLTTFRVMDLLDPEPLPPIVFEKPTRRSSLRGRAIKPRT